MLDILINKSSFAPEDLVKMVKRENNSKRNYLLVNSRQGKHIPADPLQVLDLFRQLAGEVKKNITSDKIVFIGFAETATAVGAGVAAEFKDSYYIHTTRETSTPGHPVAEFREEHSHAVEQLLYCDRWDEIIADAEHIVFAEDEISTGKTIMNFISVLKKNNKVPENVRFSACSILNGMSEELEAQLKAEGVEFYWLLRHKAEPDSDEVYTFESELQKRRTSYDISEIKISGAINPRTGTPAYDYNAACLLLADKIAGIINSEKKKSLAVIGTEECMYPAICTARVLSEKSGFEAVTHSTTRSPIVAENNDCYPLKSRHQIDSFYEKERKTYIYNSDLKKYDLVVIVTDSTAEDYDFSSFAEAFSDSDRFLLVRWVK